MSKTYNSASYVKFFRGYQDTYDNLIEKNSDTLYFIYKTDSDGAKLYLGDKLISDNITKISDLIDIEFNEIKSNDILIYNEDKWINKSIIDAIGIMTGATETSQGGLGLVPAPGEKQQNYFLRGDGTWAPIEINDNVEVDNKSISLLENNVITLKNYGKSYYYYNKEEEKYQIQEVDEEHPWSAGLEPRVVEENGEFVLGWFEPSSITIDGVADQLEALQSGLTAIDRKIVGLEEDVSLINDEVEDLKSTIEDVYTKEEVDNKIAALPHLTRKTFSNFDEALEFIQNHQEEAYNYIYMIQNQGVPEGFDKYSEYLYIEDKLELIGGLNINLEDYAKVEDLNNYIEKQEGYGLVSNTEIAKLSTIEEEAQKNLFDSVDDSNFLIDEESHQLKLTQISITQVENLIEQLNLKLEATDLESLEGRVEDLNTLLNNYVTKEEYEIDMNFVLDILTWQDLSVN